MKRKHPWWKLGVLSLLLITVGPRRSDPAGSDCKHVGRAFQLMFLRLSYLMRTSWPRSSGLWGSMCTALGFSSPAPRGVSYLGEILHWRRKESTCNAGVPGWIPGWGRSPGEGTGYPLQYPWASLVAQLVKNLPAMRETWVPSLGWEDALEEGKATLSCILAWRIPWTVQSMGSQRVGHG